MYIRIGNLRKVFEFSVDYVCRQVGCSRPQLYNLENGRYNPLNVKYKFVAGLADLYHVSCEFIADQMADDHEDYIQSCESNTVSDDQCCMFV